MGVFIIAVMVMCFSKGAVSGQKPEAGPPQIPQKEGDRAPRAEGRGGPREVGPGAPWRGGGDRGPVSFPGGYGTMFRGGMEGPAGGFSVLFRNLEIFDTDGDGALSRAEFDAAAREIFDRCDSNGDGKVDRAEMARDLSHVSVRPSTRARQILRLYDTNKDGKIVPDECLLPPKAFADLDLNKSQALENDELVKISLGQAAVLQESARRAAVLLTELDKNSDGRLAAAEFPFPKTAFAQADRNGDGYLDREELRYLPPLALDHPQRRAEALIAQMDQDGDRMLSQNEFRVPGGRFEEVDENRDGLADLREMTAWFEAGHGRFGPVASPYEMADQILDRFDRNGDGRITADERGDRMPEPLLQRADLNGDGVIEAEELEKAFSAGPPGRGMGGAPMGNPERAGARGDFARGNPGDIVKARDRDGDGKLTAQELGIDVRVFQRIDRDGDGKVTVEELAASQEMLRAQSGDLREKMRERLETGRGTKR
ncbi:MAG: EF-hand domain-containing protein [Candidatus Sumerlaeia bacterium]|nr:EF-hand domain-containing protein [Candidatus Sumerlaeia bacterium]